MVDPSTPIPEALLTTTDNKFDPFDEFEQWYMEDLRLAREQHRNTAAGYLAIIMANSDDVSDNEFNQVMNDAIDEIVELDLSGTFKKVTREAKETFVEAS